ncbi:MAG: hypothetical protein QXD43_05520, partial [Candidatus Aenigmatarchaeota archaeon]
MKYIEVKDLPKVLDNEKIDKVRSLIVNTGMPILVYNKSNKLIGVIDEYCILKNFFKPGIAKDLAIVPPTIDLEKDLKEKEK